MSLKHEWTPEEEASMRNAIFGSEWGERQFLRAVRDFAPIGYGRMMQIVAEVWYHDCIKRGDPTAGVTVPGTCLGLLPERKAEEFMALAESDKLFKD